MSSFMTPLRKLTCLLGAHLAFAGVAAGQEPPVKPAIPKAPPVEVDRSRPEGSLIRCVDGTWAPKGAAAAACDTHGGVAFRYPEITAPPTAKERPDANVPKLTVRPAPTGGLSAVQAATPPAGAVRATSTAAKSTAAPLPPPADATMACKDGTYLSGPPDAARCQSHGGLAVILPKGRP